jgi:hypothetical protein
MEYKGYTIVESSRPGAAVKGTKITSSIQVRKSCGDGYLLKKQISFPVNNAVKKAEAYEKAKKFVDKELSQ